MIATIKSGRKSIDNYEGDKQYNSEAMSELNQLK